jgi:flagellar motor switch/type III secretory pathway protein FliN
MNTLTPHHAATAAEAALPVAPACRALQLADLPRLGAAAAAVHRRLLRSTHPALRFGARAEAVGRGPGWWLDLQLGGVPVVMQASASSWPEWSPARTGAGVPEALLGAGIAHAGAPLWHALAQASGRPVQVVRARWLRDAPAAAADALAWQLAQSGWLGSLHAAGSRAWERWAAELPVPAALPWQIDGARFERALGVPIALELGRTRLPVPDMASLRRHAVLLIDGATSGGAGRPASQHAVCVLAGHRRRPVALAWWQAPGRLQRRGPPLAALASPRTSLEGIPMSNPHASLFSSADASSVDRSSADPSSADARLDLGAVDVEVRFELARQHWPIGELAQWRVGEALPFELPFADAVVSAWVHERRVASGRLVAIGDRLGLRIDALGE